MNVAELEVVMRFVEVMNLVLEFLDPAAAGGAGQFESARGRCTAAKHEKEIQQGAEQRTDPDEYGPDVFAAPHGIDEHPGLKHHRRRTHDQCWYAVPILEESAH